MSEEEPIERWALAPEELPLLVNMTGVTRLGFALLLRYFAGEGRFPKSKGEVPGQAVAYVGRHVGVPAEEYLRYDWRGRAIKYHRAQVRAHFGFREATVEDGEALAAWLAGEVLPREQDPDAVREVFYGRCEDDLLIEGFVLWDFAPQARQIGLASSREAPAGWRQSNRASQPGGP